MKKALTAIAFAVATLAASTAGATNYVDFIATGAQDARLYAGDTLSSPNFRYKAYMQPDGRLVVYRMSDYVSLYQSTSQPIAGFTYALVKRDISIGIYSDAAFGRPVQEWTNGTAQPGVVDTATKLSLTNDGMLVLGGAPHPGSPWPDTVWWQTRRDNYVATCSSGAPTQYPVCLYGMSVVIPACSIQEASKFATGNGGHYGSCQ